MMPIVASIDRQRCRARFLSGRARSKALFDSIRPEAYTSRPIPLRNPVVFYEGHLPAFSVNTLLKRGLGEKGIDAGFEVLFERGIDPEDPAQVASGPAAWPSRRDVLRYAEEADRRLLEAIEEKDLEREENPVLARGLALYTILEHEEMHQETLSYMWHRLAYDQKVPPANLPSLIAGGEPPEPRSIRIPAGEATLGADPDTALFGWDNEFPRQVVEVSAFEIDVFNVTNRDFLSFVESGGYRDRSLWSEEGWDWLRESGARHPLFWERENGRWIWRGMWERLPLPPAWPVYVSQAEASAYARWKGKRLLSEAQFHRAAYGDPSGAERSYPWGEEPPDATRGNFDFRRSDPVPVGSYPAGASAWGVHDLVGNGWEWTSTVFGPFPGFEPMAPYPQYSADFFDGKHFVMKGASPVTAKSMVRRSFRNWFRGNYPYVYATFRCVKS
jgi:ergothioneine biosynthesis protein EgtB